MKKFSKHYTFLVSLTIFVTLVSPTAFAQMAPTNVNITVTTDRSSYIFGDTIVVSGYIKTVVQGNVLTIRILDSYSNLVQEAQATVGTNGHYTASIEIDGSMWKTGGTYTVLVQYGSSVQTQTSFSYTSTTAPINGIFQVQIPNSQETIGVPYAINGGSVKNMAVDLSNISLTILIKSTNYGSITFSLPRTLLDSKTTFGTDAPFSILSDGEPIKPQKEQVSSNERTLTIQFLQGDQAIQIFGTSAGSQSASTSSFTQNTSNNTSTQTANMSNTIQAVPEFSLVIPVLLIGITSLIIFHRIQFNVKNSRRSIML
ncbi:MAG TPA: hypothetical protein VEJ68_05470 [Candidatus Bathyarchaeia archaeon]|nr:hypothetical protein [Candidatus Bathyarchaeia archaeon]